MSNILFCHVVTTNFDINFLYQHGWIDKKVLLQLNYGKDGLVFNAKFMFFILTKVNIVQYSIAVFFKITIYQLQGRF
jgi:hypothetical protein